MLERVSLIVSLGARHLGAYGDLVAEDLSAASVALGRRLWVGAVLAMAVLLFVEISCFWIIAAAWNTPFRHWAIGALAAFFLLVVGASAIVLRMLRKRSPPLLALSAQEWEKDRKVLTELLGPSRGAADATHGP